VRKGNAKVEKWNTVGQLDNWANGEWRGETDKKGIGKRTGKTTGKTTGKRTGKEEEKKRKKEKKEEKKRERDNLKNPPGRASIAASHSLSTFCIVGCAKRSTQIFMYQPTCLLPTPNSQLCHPTQQQQRRRVSSPLNSP
jgi:hypothetical protein